MQKSSKKLCKNTTDYDSFSNFEVLERQARAAILQCTQLLFTDMDCMQVSGGVSEEDNDGVLDLDSDDEEIVVRKGVKKGAAAVVITDSDDEASLPTRTSRPARGLPAALVRSSWLELNGVTVSSR
jgi:hypothetical protein